MKKMFAIAWKDARIRFSGFSELIFFIILPIVFTFILGGSPNPGDADNRIRTRRCGPGSHLALIRPDR